jgi:hypothetical protein
VGVRRIAEESMWWPRGSNVIELGRAQIVSNLTDSYWSLEPLYMRLSAAEEKKADTVAESSPISILRK